MERFNHIQDVRYFLDSVPKFSHSGQKAANFSLDRMIKICSEMGNPQNNFRSIHVAGTNGKGTVCRMLASIYQEAGYKTALYTSPHLIKVEERFRINGAEIDPENIVLFFQKYGALMIHVKATYFEITTALAFWYFHSQYVDIAIIEVGLGGRLDATNVIQPIATVITSIGKDHTEILGSTISAIALEKGGIIKNKTPLFVGRLDPESELVLKEQAKSFNAPYYEYASEKIRYKPDIITIFKGEDGLSFKGKHYKAVDAQNASLVINIVTHLQQVMNVQKIDIVEGLNTMVFKFPETAVFEKIHPIQNWYFDGAHNPAAVKQLTDHLILSGSPESWKVVLSFASDKLNDEVAALWMQFSDIYVYQMDSPRAADLSQLRAFFPGSKIFFPEMITEKNHFKSELVIFSGSFYFYDTVRKWMGTMTVK